MAARIKLTLAYLGTPYSGWQSQPNNNAIQDHLERALEKIGGQKIRATGSGRTDAGVHAKAQIAHFDPPESRARMQPQQWQHALNAALPPEIRIMHAGLAPTDFHARFSATGKEYRYRLHLGEILPPQLHHRAWHLRQPIDEATLKTALSHYQGTHDFQAFAANRGDAKESLPGYATRTLTAVTYDAATTTISVQGTGFLYKMVRLLVGSAIQVATHREPIDWLDTLLHNPHGKKSQHCAPAAGLTLHRVDYCESS